MERFLLIFLYQCSSFKYFIFKGMPEAFSNVVFQTIKYVKAGSELRSKEKKYTFSTTIAK